MPKESPNAYLDTVDRLEPDITMIDSGAGWASIAISLKRIADALERLVPQDRTATATELGLDPTTGRPPDDGALSSEPVKRRQQLSDAAKNMREAAANAGDSDAAKRFLWLANGLQEEADKLAPK